MTDSKKIENGGPAYPVTFEGGRNNGESPYFDEGMSKREHFAGMAMQGLLAANALYGGKSDARGRLAADAVAHADALLAALSPSQS